MPMGVQALVHEPRHHCCRAVEGCAAGEDQERLLPYAAAGPLAIRRPSS